jgi:lambda family phage portal protein
MLCRSWSRDGEVLSQLIAGTVPGLDHGTRVPFSIEMLEADFLPMHMNTLAPTKIVQGVEVNAWGAPVAFHVYKDDPLEGGSLVGAQTKRLSADRMLHLKTVHRIRQVRGVSVFASVLNRFDDLKDYEESERIAAKIAASMAAYIKKGSPDLYEPKDGEEQRQMKFRPGMVFDDLRPGEEIGMINTNRPNPNLETYRGGQLKAIAAGTGPTYSSIARTYDGTYSAQRQELVEGYAAYAVLSAEFISRISRPVYERFVATAVASGALRVPPGIRPGTLADATYMPPAMPWIDPKKEAEAWGMLEDRAYASGPEIIRKRGGNPMDVLEQQGRWMREKEREGVPPNASGGQPTLRAQTEGE